MSREFSYFFLRFSSEFAILCSKLDALSPLKVLGRGYSITKKDGVVINRFDSLKLGDKVSIQFADGSVDAEIIWGIIYEFNLWTSSKKTWKYY